MSSLKRPLLATALVVALAAPWAATTFLPARAGDAVTPPATTSAAPVVPATLSVSAEAQVRIAPDMATINAGVVTQAATADVAMKENRDKMTAVFDALKKAGIADKDLQSSGITINPQYKYADNQPPQVTGYQASNSVNVVLRDIASVGGVIDALVGQGVNQLNGPNFDVADKDSALNEARTEAVKKAQERAKLYASAAGVRITRLQSLMEGNTLTPRPPYPMARMAMLESADASTPVAPGEIELGVTVSLTYEISE